LGYVQEIYLIIKGIHVGYFNVKQRDLLHLEGHRKTILVKERDKEGLKKL
jgi:hypothetical protein